MLTKVIEQSKIDHFTKWFDRADKIVIVSHVGPDGDAIGSSLGLWHFFSSQGKTANVIVPNAFPDFLKWMPGSKDILLYDRYKEFADKLIAEADVICCLDFNAIHRIDAMGDAVLASPARKILIDHHVPYRPISDKHFPPKPLSTRRQKKGTAQNTPPANDDKQPRETSLKPEPNIIAILVAAIGIIPPASSIVRKKGAGNEEMPSDKKPPSAIEPRSVNTDRFRT